jgi:fatty acid desaturase
VCPGDQWRHSHNYMHHTYTNILGKDRDIGYGVLRMDEDQRGTRTTSATRSTRRCSRLFFQYGVMLHDLEVERIVTGEAHLGGQGRARRIWRKAAPADGSRTTCCSRC